MFFIEIAGVKIGVENKYGFVRDLCKKYIIDTSVSDFCVSVSDDEIRAEALEDFKEAEIPYLESIAIYRKICNKMLSFDAFLFHSATVSIDGKAYAFAAPSGTGKTTHCVLLKRLLGDKMKVINGDKPIIRFFDGVPYAFGTPWAGKEGAGQNIKAPLEAICFLEQSKDNSITRLSLSAAAERSLSQVLLRGDGDSVCKTMELIDRMLREVDLYLLRCNISEEAAKLSYKTLTGDLTYEN